MARFTCRSSATLAAWMLKRVQQGERKGCGTPAASGRSPAMPSTVIRAFSYDPAARRLDIEFVSGNRYSYLDVPARVVEAMRRAGSKGGFFNRRIRDRYRFVRL